MKPTDTNPATDDTAPDPAAVTRISARLIEIVQHAQAQERRAEARRAFRRPTMRRSLPQFL